MKPSQYQNKRHTPVLLMLILLVGYLVFPVFTSVHIEGFSGQIESIAYLKSVNLQLNHDPYMALITQFIYQTRAFVVLLLAGIFSLFGNINTLAFQILTASSLLVLATASVLFAQIWLKKMHLHWGYALLAIALTPGIFELGFYFNDNIVSAALAVMALLVISWQFNSLTVIVSAILFTLATLSRIDAIFIGPIILGVMIYQAISLRYFLKYSILYALSVLSIYLLSFFALGFTLIDAFLLAQKFILDISYLKNLVLTKLYFLGLVIVPPLLIGLYTFSKSQLQQKHYILIISFVVYPILLFLFAPKATETRYIFPLLSPIIALMGAIGLHNLVKAATHYSFTKTKLLAYGYGISVIVIMAWPPMYSVFKDGPRSVTGRLWSPIVWQDWQNSVNTSLSTLNQLIADTQTPDNIAHPSLFITLHYNDEYYLRMKLIEQGYLPQQATQDTAKKCIGVSFFKKDTHLIYHLRTRPSYGIAPISYHDNTALQLQLIDQCIGLNAFQTIYLTDYQRASNSLRNAVFGSFLVQPSYQHQLPDFLKRTAPAYGTIKYAKLSSHNLKNALYNAQNILAHPSTNKRLTVQELLEYYQPQKSLFAPKESHE